MNYPSSAHVIATEQHDSDHSSAQHQKLDFPSKPLTQEGFDCSVKSVSAPPSSFNDEEGKNKFVSCVELGTGYKINDMDVICGRGKSTLHNKGNVHFRQIALERSAAYFRLQTRALKRQFVAEIIAQVRSAGGHFLQRHRHRDDGSGSAAAGPEWYDIGDEAAAAKVGHALRDATKQQGSTSPRSSASTAAKKKSRRHQADKQQNEETGGLESLEELLLGETSFYPTNRGETTAELEANSALQIEDQNMVENFADWEIHPIEDALCGERSFHPIDIDMTTLDSLFWATEGMLNSSDLGTFND